MASATCCWVIDGIIVSHVLYLTPHLSCACVCGTIESIATLISGRNHDAGSSPAHKYALSCAAPALTLTLSRWERGLWGLFHLTLTHPYLDLHPDLTNPFLPSP
jgi:hypothetical protein